jgi:hypothetical protein
MLRILASATGPVDLLEEFEKTKNPVWKALFPGDEEDRASFGRVYFQVTKRTAFEVRSFLPHRGCWQSHVSWRGTGIHPGDKPDVCSLYNKIGTSI